MPARKKCTPTTVRILPSRLVRLVAQYDDGLTVRALAALLWPDASWQGRGGVATPRGQLPSPAAMLHAQLKQLAEKGLIEPASPLPDVDTLAGLRYRLRGGR